MKKSTLKFLIIVQLVFVVSYQAIYMGDILKGSKDSSVDAIFVNDEVVFANIIDTIFEEDIEMIIEGNDTTLIDIISTIYISESDTFVMSEDTIHIDVEYTTTKYLSKISEKEIIEYLKIQEWFENIKFAELHKFEGDEYQIYYGNDCTFFPYSDKKYIYITTLKEEGKRVAYMYDVLGRYVGEIGENEGLVDEDFFCNLIPVEN